MSAVAARRQRVMQLYRHALKTCLDWSGSRQQWYPRACAIRAEFEANRNVVAFSDSAGRASLWHGEFSCASIQGDRDHADRLVSHGEALLQEWKYPDPITPPYYVGGTAFSRNPPMPKDIKIVLDFGRENAAH